MRKIVAAVTATACLLLTAGCATNSAESSPPNAEPVASATANNDPRQGWVEIQPFDRYKSLEEGEGIWKKCDGTTLMYSAIVFGPAGGFSTIPNSPECVAE